MSDGVNTTANTVGSIAEALNAQSYSALSQYTQSLPTITSIDNAAYGFASNLNSQVASSENALASNLLTGVNNMVSSNQNMVANNSAGAIQQYNAIAQTGKKKK